MFVKLLTLTICLLMLMTESAQAQDVKEARPERLGLWNKRAPIGDGKFQEAEAWITVHRPKQPNGTAIVICPGGGYGGLVTGAEGPQNTGFVRKRQEPRRLKPHTDPKLEAIRVQSAILQEHAAVAVRRVPEQAVVADA